MCSLAVSRLHSLAVSQMRSFSVSKMCRAVVSQMRSFPVSQVCSSSVSQMRHVPVSQLAPRLFSAVAWPHSQQCEVGEGTDGGRDGAGEPLGGQRSAAGKGAGRQEHDVVCSHCPRGTTYKALSIRQYLQGTSD